MGGIGLLDLAFVRGGSVGDTGAFETLTGTRIIYLGYNPVAPFSLPGDWLM